MDYSVLMSVYYRENPRYLRGAIESILNQTIKTNDFVIVCDGPLNEELDRVMDEFYQKYPVLFRIIRLDENKGLAKALNAGLEQCKNNIVARMDSDDISFPTRIERQLQVMENTGADIVGCTIQEFSGEEISFEKIKENTEALGKMRKLPSRHEDILKFARRRSPFNHPTVMYRKDVVEKCGKYEDYSFFEDYNLWTTMLLNGAKGYNIEDVLLYMRAGDDMYKRRGGLKYVKHICRFKKHLKDSGFIDTKEYIIGTVGHCAVSLMPNRMRKFLYSKVFRKE